MNHDGRSEEEAVTHTLSDEQITSERRRRRTFLGSALLGTAAIAAAGFMQGCGKSDRCDTDTSRFRDSDPNDSARTTADACDSDGT